MSPDDVPPLSEGDDPFRLLGLDEATATAAECKRAWTRLLKVYRPDRAPEAFARLRAAYEAAVERLQARSASRGAPVRGRESIVPASGVEERPHAPDPRTRAAFLAVAEGRTEEARLALDREHESEPSSRALIRASFLLREMEDQEDRALTDLGRDMAKDATLAAWAVEVLNEHERTRLPQVDEVTLGVLAAQRDARAALGLMRARVDALLSSGHVERLLREVEAPALLDRAREDARFVGPIVEVTCAGALRHPDTVEKIHTRVARIGAGDEDVRVALEMRLGARKGWLAWGRAHRDLEDLGRFIEIAPALGPRALQDECRTVARAIRRQPGDHVRALEALGASDSDLLVQFWDVLEKAREDAVERGEDEEARPARAGTRRKTVLRAALKEADKALDGDWANTLHTWGLVVGVGLTVYLFIAHGAWGWAGVGATLLLLILGTTWNDKRLYRRILRPRMAHLVAHTGCTVAELLEALKDSSKITDDVGRFDGEIESDTGLDLISRIVELSRMR